MIYFFILYIEKRYFFCILGLDLNKDLYLSFWKLIKYLSLYKF